MVTATPLDDYEGSTTRAAVILLHDVTVDHRRFEELERFAGVVAHDLKSPLTAVTGWSELLQEQLAALDAPSVPAAVATVDRIQASAERMWCLIDDLLDFTRSTSGELHVSEVDLQELTDGIAAAIQSTPAGAEASFHIEGLEDVAADALLVEQVLVNLLGNAVKYVGPGVRPHVEVLGSPDDAWLEITVRDNGIGIPVEDRRKVFEPFVRSATEGYTGTGLGLAIARGAIERHGGTIRVAAGPGGPGHRVHLRPAGRSEVHGAARREVGQSSPPEDVATRTRRRRHEEGPGQRGYDLSLQRARRDSNPKPSDP